MRVIFTRKTKDDFRKHNDYIRKQKKSDGHKYQSYESKGINDSFKKNLKGNLEMIKDPKDSIFPKEFEYNSESHKMYIDKKSHHIVFYKVIKPKKGESYISVEKSIHSMELRKELEKKDIKPLENSDPELQLDFLDVEYEDMVNNLDKDEDIPQEIKDKYNEKKSKLETKINKQNKVEKGNKNNNKPEIKKEVITDPKTGKKITKVKHTGPRGGKFYNNDEGEKVYPPEWNESLKSIETKITESKMRSLVDYLKEMVG